MDFKRGDTVICKTGFTKSENSGGTGYEPDRVFVVYDISQWDDYAILWPQGIGGGRDNGIYSRACELYQPQVWSGSKLVFNFINQNNV